MEPFGIYHYLNPEQKDSSFMVKTMEEVYNQTGGEPDQPHRHDYYVILIIKEAQGLHKVDFTEYQLEGNEVFFVAPGQVHQIIEEKPSVGFIITFSKDFLIQNGINECFIIDINLFQQYGASPPLRINDETYGTLESLINQMFHCLSQESRFKMEAVSAYLKLMLITCNDIKPEPETDIQTYQTSSELLRRFKILVEGHFKKDHRVSYYADQLSITSDYLNKVVKNTIGVSAKDYILSRILVEAKRELIYSSLSSKEIGYHLGFSDPAYFSNFFKKMTDQSLTDFRNQNKK